MTLAEAVTDATARLAAAGIEDSRRDARLLICRLLEAGPELLLAHPDRLLTAAEEGRIEAAVGRRAAREPVARILGLREFWSLPFVLNAETLDPRPDSETLVEAVLDEVADRQAALRLLDLGSGSGCLLLALLSELPNALGTGIDLSAAAVSIAVENAERLGLAARARFLRHSWNDGLDLENGGPESPAWDIIVSNPPYIASADIAALAPEVAGYDPPAALDGGADGLAAYRDLIPAAAGVLALGGLLALEVGFDQAEAVEELVAAAALRPFRRAADLSGTERCLLAARMAPKAQNGADFTPAESRG